MPSGDCQRDRSIYPSIAALFFRPFFQLICIYSTYWNIRFPCLGPQLFFAAQIFNSFLSNADQKNEILITTSAFLPLTSCWRLSMCGALPRAHTHRLLCTFTMQYTNTMCSDIPASHHFQVSTFRRSEEESWRREALKVLFFLFKSVLRVRALNLTYRFW